ncbi:hypothetical protein EV643_11776 [Kribbella sp. VKM Ac-2527]|uniref:LVIVD repeat-containing protein n=1 Tax=Kribbella caucasensis TaxID=2512215 RepID=A0A4R6K3X6_9ACTN|nr:hypothetical protein [Kribbella sp. VKM Ac-2527]TDO44053.1 hypothetical protein EV643_11776 [Kribbella sp. VKM Ac-2527]
MRARGLALGALALTIGLSTGVVLAGPSSADEPVLVNSVGTQLPVDDFRAMELDEVRGRLYLAQGAGSELPLVVTDLDGVLQAKVSAVTGASDVVLSDDHHTLLVAADFDHVTAVDADTLVPSATYAAPTGACVYAVEPAGDKIVGAYYNCGIGSGGLLIWSAPGTAPVVYTGGPNYHPIIDAIASGLIVAGDTGYSPVSTYVIDVSGTTPTILSKRDNAGSNLIDYAVSPDGTEVVETVGHQPAIPPGLRHPRRLHRTLHRQPRNDLSRHLHHHLRPPPGHHDLHRPLQRLRKLVPHRHRGDHPYPLTRLAPGR